ncbi:single-stranded-DNA-specific exonuclease RecJ [Dulcicalothrix desertica PCC 7102]|uniref:Single-stranded-DNA-specific exonuclease RecJ n=1 Tax=Dulcicalothrix desertica PCC 7102 TaxID=232991 RepID=A0A3S1CJA6_9CYAN|nr:DHH family phosphoesterase [Dulcicalothrix desertica]RUT04654.1 single-stranded-DNA-specific exonuclease RecJ [Dulcicalothrix desertica PCC 7102]TWH42661.1 single-stranded-DNA-specific exonuclease [Dulcicalothrix desertica PCC 7102]
MLNTSFSTSIVNTRRLPDQRWQIQPERPELAQMLADRFNISPIISQLLINRGIDTLYDAEIFLEPELLNLPSPLEDFPDLAVSLELLENAIASQAKIAICGDYDADGMTSTALLLRSLRYLGAQVDYAIPSRMHEGYGVNKRIIEEFHSEGVELILTVDNGISAFEPIARARELGLKVIITDHHDIPQKLPPANAILNPKLIREDSPYRGVAGVGVAYILAVSLAEQLGQANSDITTQMLELFTLGTIADLAPLTGVNRRWVQSGLKVLPKSNLAGIQALIQMSGVQAPSKDNTNILTPDFGNQKSTIKNPKSLKPEDIGFRLGPRINAIGRIADPQIVIELLTTDDMGMALERAMQCESINRQRQDMCKQIEEEAIEYVETRHVASLHDDRVLLVVCPGWHHGVIGIVASRLVERYGVPVFIGTYEDEGHIRGSARGIPEFNIFEALEYCHNLLGKYGGHKAAGGFSIPAENLELVHSRLSEFANKCLELQHLKPLLKIDTLANLNQLNQKLYRQLNVLEPCGIENPEPVFWTPNVRIIEQGTVGKAHIKMTIEQMVDNRRHTIKAIAWRWREYCPLPANIDIAYKLRENTFNGETNIELEIIGARLPIPTPQSQVILFNQFKSVSTKPRTQFEHLGRSYTCCIYNNDKNNGALELRIQNSEGKILAATPNSTTGLLGSSRQDAKEVDISQPPYDTIIRAALQALDNDDF